MKLANYLKSQSVSMMNFAALIHVGYHTVGCWIRGKNNPSKNNVERIAKATGNKVTSKDWSKI